MCSFPGANPRAVPSGAQEDGEEMLEEAGQTPGSPAPMLKPAST